MKLYYSPGACSLSPHIVAREAGLDLELEKVDLAAKKTASGEDYLAINPKGYVPTLALDDGQRLTEGPAIVQYLADLRPESGLAPAAGTLARYRLQEWLGYLNSEIHKSYSPLFSADLAPELREERTAYLTKRYAIVERALNGQDGLLGATFTVADAYLYTVTNWARMVRLDLSGFPRLLDFQKRVAARPAVRAAMSAEGLGG